MLVLIRMAEPISRILSSTDGPCNLGEQQGLKMEGGVSNETASREVVKSGRGWRMG